MSDVLVSVDNVRKKFCRSLKKSLWYGVQDMAGEIFGNRSERALRPDEFWAVKDVSFEIRRGESLGLIGRNGAGKTTLLRMLNGLIKPDGGRIEMRGRVGALIALGAGFNPILTGRENIYVNASVLGLTKREIDVKIKEIIDFAEIREFIDSPVQNYSSGMQVRLGFAVATSLEPDILILDEVLSVGDSAFRAKCYNRINMLQRNSAVIFVTHSMEQASRVCNKAICLHCGRVAQYGDVEQVVEMYGQLNTHSDDGTESFLSLDENIESGGVSIEPNTVYFGGTLDVRVICEGKNKMEPCRLRVLFYAENGAIVGEYDSRTYFAPLLDIEGQHVFEKNIGPLNLLKGHYKIGVNLIGEANKTLYLWSYKQYILAINGPQSGVTFYQVPEIR